MSHPRRNLQMKSTRSLYVCLWRINSGVEGYVVNCTYMETVGVSCSDVMVAADKTGKGFTFPFIVRQCKWKRYGLQIKRWEGTWGIESKCLRKMYAAATPLLWSTSRYWCEVAEFALSLGNNIFSNFKLLKLYVIKMNITSLKLGKPYRMQS